MPTEKNFIALDGDPVQTPNGLRQPTLLVNSYDDQVIHQTPTGLIWGGVLEVTPGQTQIDTAHAGAGRINTSLGDPQSSSGFTDITWEEESNIPIANIATEPLTWYKRDMSGTLIAQNVPFTVEDYRDYIVIGSVLHPLGTITKFAPAPFSALGSGNLSQFLAASGGFSVTGNQFGPSGANLLLSKTEGEVFQLGANYENDPELPSLVASPALADQQIFYVYSNAAGDDLDVVVTAGVEPSWWDDGSGTIQTQGGNKKATAHYIYHFPITGSWAIRLGNMTYKNLATAVEMAEGQRPFVNEDFKNQGYLACVLVTTVDCSDLTDPRDAQFFNGSNILGSGLNNTTVGVSKPLEYDTEISAYVPLDSIAHIDAAGTTQTLVECEVKDRFIMYFGGTSHEAGTTIARSAGVTINGLAEDYTFTGRILYGQCSSANDWTLTEVGANRTTIDETKLLAGLAGGQLYVIEACVGGTE